MPSQPHPRLPRFDRHRVVRWLPGGVLGHLLLLSIIALLLCATGAERSEARHGRIIEPFPHVRNGIGGGRGMPFLFPPGHERVYPGSWIVWYAHVYEPRYVDPAPRWRDGGLGVLRGEPPAPVLCPNQRREIVSAMRTSLATPDSQTAVAAAVALAKCATTPKSIEAIIATIRSDDRLNRIRAIAIATLALGLLRRSDPERQFEGRTLDLVRHVLIRLAEAGEGPRELVRGAAMLALGLLGDQPTQDGASVSVASLIAHVSSERPASQTYTCAALALGEFPRSAFTDAQRETLVSLCLARKKNSSALGRVVGRLGPPLDLTALRKRLRRERFCGKGQALVAAARRLGERFPDRREETGRLLVERVRGRPMDARHAFHELAQLVCTDIRDDRTELIEQTDLVSLLLETSDRSKSRRLRLNHGALALARIAAAIQRYDPTSPAYEALRGRIVRMLRWRAMEPGLSVRSKGAFVMSLAIAGDEQSIPTTTRLLVASPSSELRMHCLEALRISRAPSAAALSAVRAGIEQRMTDGCTFPARCAQALGAWGDASDVERLLDAQRKWLRTDPKIVGAASRALAALRHPRSIQPLIARAHDESLPGRLRAQALATLGMMMDPEEEDPSLNRYRSAETTEWLQRVYRIIRIAMDLL